jgi:hypothetical protein
MLATIAQIAGYIALVIIGIYVFASGFGFGYHVLYEIWEDWKDTMQKRKNRRAAK